MDPENSTLNSVIDWLTLHGIDWVLKIAVAVVLFVIGRWAVGLITGLLSRTLIKASVDPTLTGFLVKIAHVFLMVAVVLGVLDSLGIKTTGLLAILGAAGLAVGLALQSSLANFAAGVMLIIFRPFKVGDFIDAGGTKGIVEGINIFNTNMRTPQNQVVILPNGQVGGGSITNYSVKETRRIDLTMGVSYNDDLRVAKDTIWKVLNRDERILKDPAAIVGVMELGPSSVDIVVWFWVNSPDFLMAKMDTTEQLKFELEAAGCSIPYPQRDVHIFSVENQSA